MDMIAWLRGQIETDLTAAAVSHDPRHVTADCEGKLEILRDHHIVHRGDRDEWGEEFSVLKIGRTDRDYGCVTCHYQGYGGVRGYGYCMTVRHLASCYSDRDGYCNWNEYGT